MPVEKVLIPVDWSEYSERAFNWYVDQVHQEGTLVILLHFIDATSEKDLEDKKCKMMELVDRYRKRLVEKKIHFKWLTGNPFDSGTPGECIIKVSLEQEVGLILMASRGLGKIKKAFLGSVSDFVLNESTVPVIICKRPEK